ncbi:MAG: phosphate ABC transporter ATP-binding protein, partial [Xanthomonadaceae bacterium]|nr:phosphate ABC transporter ATP-binding protein [Xanthomonadaceae bacterium]
MTEDTALFNPPPASAQTVAAATVSPPAKLAVRNLNFLYGDSPALKNISMDLPEKRVSAIIGP